MTPSLFALLQSAAAGGYGVAPVSAGLQGIGALLGGSSAALLFANNMRVTADSDHSGDKEKED